MREIEPIECPSGCETMLDMVTAIYNGNTGLVILYWQCPICKTVFWI
jgi:hypothetical protein